MDVFSMRFQYFPNVTEQGTDIAGQVSFLVDQGKDAVSYESHRTVREALTSKMEVEATKQLAKARFVKEVKKRNVGNSDGAQLD